MAVVEEKVKKFKSMTDQEVRIALTSGHSVVIPHDDWREIPKRFWSHAYALGCESEDMTDKVIHNPDNLDARKERIMLAIDSMVKAAEKDEVVKAEIFTKAGSPDINKLSTKLGFSIKTQERDLLWEEYPEWAGKRQAAGLGELDLEEDATDDDIKE